MQSMHFFIQSVIVLLKNAINLCLIDGKQLFRLVEVIQNTEYIIIIYIVHIKNLYLIKTTVFFKYKIIYNKNNIYLLINFLINF